MNCACQPVCGVAQPGVSNAAKNAWERNGLPSFSASHSVAGMSVMVSMICMVVCKALEIYARLGFDAISISMLFISDNGDRVGQFDQRIGCTTASDDNMLHDGPVG